jgi:hypothetical protein
MFFKKAQAGTDTVIILSILSFQTFIILCLGFLSTTQTTYVGSDNISFNITGVSTISSGNRLFSFGNIISNISELGWGNSLLFTPLLICIGYIVAKLIRGGG